MRLALRYAVSFLIGLTIVVAVVHVGGSGGVGAFTLGFLSETSISAGVTGLGLLLLGIALVVGDVNGR